MSAMKRHYVLPENVHDSERGMPEYCVFYDSASVDARNAELEQALREAMEWNWCDDDMNEGVRAMCERALGDRPSS
jgi:hypothetical protein